MPSLDDILNSGTLLRVGNGNAAGTPGVPQPMPPANAKTSKKSDEDKAIWHYTHVGARLDHVESVTCEVNSMGFMEMTVCESIDWGPVDVSVRGDTINLPLTPTFMLFNESITSGHVPGSGSGFWQLEANLDQSFQAVFCYDLGPPGTNSMPVAVAAAVTKQPNFMPDPAKTDLPVEAVCGEVCTIGLPNLFVVVVVSLVCCKERFDFEPGGVLGAARLYPLIQVVATDSLDKIVAKVRMKRPQNGMGDMDGESMTRAIGSGLYADLNNTIGPPTTWIDTFSHNWIDPAAGDYVVVDPAKPARTISGAVLNQGARLANPILGQDQVVSSPVDIAKLAGQGEFDNLHIAPKMIAPKEVLANNPGDATLTAIAMAPFCVHDCMHTHVRWGNGKFAQPKHIKGWDGFTPYSKIGAPLVPPNQKITLTLVSPVEFVYKAEVTPSAQAPIKPGQWQIVNHHGSAYAVNIGFTGKSAKLAVGVMLRNAGEMDFADEHGTWAMFYWHLRFARGFSNVRERVKVIDMAKARS